ncbi:alpha/beta fold hydrolase [Streptomyces albus]|uniref:alpha/beta fold hydrolase n=1 Tax=Streptomyces sp. PHES57 TaxID=2872626 RepID=UPI001CECA946|nr:alpha/beta fold hydrolase [Streptomyces sp. PHES57]
MPLPVLLRRGTPLVSAVLLSGLLLPSASAASAPPKKTGELTWRPCHSVAKDWPDPDDTRTECAQLRVPLDYSKPDGRKISIAVSRLKAENTASKAPPLVYGSGGPGLMKVSAPAGVLKTGLRPLAADHDIVSMDDRGAGYSEKVNCDSEPVEDTPPTAGPKERAKAEFDYQSAYNKRCAAKDPEFARQLTPANAARDLDAFRQALGAPQIDYYGVSFSTAVGLAYRSLFDDRVHRMWLDSVMPPAFDHSTMDGDVEATGHFDGFVQWLARHDAEFHLGTDKAAIVRRVTALRDELDRKPRVVGDEVMNGDWVAGLVGDAPSAWATSAAQLIPVLEGETPTALPKTKTSPERRTYGFDTPHGGLNALQYTAMLCNTATSATGFSEMWDALQARRAAAPATGGSYFTSECADWPLRVPPTPVTRGHSPLQLSGHLTEAITPYVWAQRAKKAAGASLLTVKDDAHSSLSGLPCVTKVLAFFRDGTTTNGTCPGVQ